MVNLKQKITEFMRGRNGIDHLYMVNLAIYFIGLMIINRLNHILILNILLFLFIAWTFFRVFSKNIAKRQAENQALLRFSKGIQSKGSLVFKRLKDIGSHRYRQCPNCQTNLRLPRKIGEHMTKCPRCQQRFQIKIRI